MWRRLRVSIDLLEAPRFAIVGDSPEQTDRIATLCRKIDERSEVTIYSPHDAVLALPRVSFDYAILDESVPEALRDTLTSAAKAACPTCKVFIIYGWDRQPSTGTSTS